MSSITPGTRYEVCGPQGYGVSLGAIPIPSKGGAPDTITVQSVDEGIVIIEERWAQGKTRTRRTYTEILESLLRHEDIRALDGQEESSGVEEQDESETPDQSPAEDDLQEGTETTNTVDRAADSVDATPDPDAEGDEAGEYQHTYTDGDDVEFVGDDDSEMPEQPEADSTEQSTEAGSGDDSEFIVGS